jgi:tetratricopeptide (TPR) repeat protein
MKSILSPVCTILLPISFAFSSPPQGQKSDTLQSKQYLEEAKKNFNTPRLADSLARLSFQLAGTNASLRGHSASAIMFANLSTNYEVASQWADTAIHNFQKSKNNLWTGYTLRMLGVQAILINKNDQAIKCLQDGLGYFEKAKDTLMMAENHVSLSLLYHNNIMDFKKGLEYGLEALRIIESQHRKREVLNWRAINAVAINYDDAKEWDKALAYHKRNLSFENPEYKNSTLNNIGNTLRKKGEFAKARDYFLQSLAIASRDSVIDRSYHLATVYLNLTQVSFDLQNMKMALFLQRLLPALRAQKQ